MKITGSKLLVEQFQMDEVTPGGIALPSKAIQTLPFGRVIKKGPDVPDLFTNGDIVMWQDIGPIPIELKGERFLLIEAEDILGILEEGEY